MNQLLPQTIQTVIAELTKLPGIGPKTAQRLAFHLLKRPESQLTYLGEAVARIREGIKLCQCCCMLTSSDLCIICQDASRIKNTICIVSHILDVVAIEKARKYHGVYHVLHGVLSPIEGIGPADLKIQELIHRLKNQQQEIHEVILATNPNIEGETTALYIGKLLSPLTLKITRIALGMPAGGELEYADEITIGRAIEGRREYR